MARRLGRRKMPSREKYTVREQNKIDSGIFDDKTMILLSKFYNKHMLAQLSRIIARGKEADVYLGEAGHAESLNEAKFIIIKFFRVETTSFLKMSDYIIGDTRFSGMRIKKGSIIEIWCKKELGNLKIANEAGIFAPKPYMANGSILAMEFIGNKDGVQAPQLRFASPKDPNKFLDIIIEQMKSLYKFRLVHADLSEYNILFKEEKPYFIDFGQAVVLKHPNAEFFLKRDVINVLQYFSKKYGITRDEEETLNYIKS